MTADHVHKDLLKDLKDLLLIVFSKIFSWLLLGSSAQVPRILANPFSGHSEDGVVQDTRMPGGMEGWRDIPPGPRNPQEFIGDSHHPRQIRVVKKPA